MTRRIIISTVLASFISGCSINPMTGNSKIVSGDNDLVISMSASYYRDFISQKSKEGLVDSAPEIDSRVKTIAEKTILSAKEFMPTSKDWNWEFHVIKDDNVVNAFCAAGGKIVVYTGIVKQLELNDDEIAMILGHEAAHALLGHSAQKMVAGKTQEILLKQYSKNSGNLSKAQQLEKLSDLLITLPYSRKNEREADRIGAQLAFHAGYDLFTGSTLWEKMAKLNKSINPITSTHPMSTERLEYLNILANKINKADRKSAVLLSVKDSYKQFQKGETILADKDDILKSMLSGWNEEQMRDLYEDGSWKELAIVTINAGIETDLHYFYLAESARNLGYADASEVYYRKALDISSPEKKCDKPSIFQYQCGDVHVWQQSKQHLK